MALLVDRKIDGQRVGTLVDLRYTVRGTKLLINLKFLSIAESKWFLGGHLPQPFVLIMRRLKMFQYRLHYLADMDDANWKRIGAQESINVGDILRLSCNYYHVTCAVIKQKTGYRLDLSKSCQTADEAMLVAKQMGYYPPKGESHVERLHPRVFEGEVLIEL